VRTQKPFHLCKIYSTLSPFSGVLKIFHELEDEPWSPEMIFEGIEKRKQEEKFWQDSKKFWKIPRAKDDDENQPVQDEKKMKISD
jgi:hypothetical protein